MNNPTPEQDRIIAKENESFAVWNILFYGALKELVDLKLLKDTQGKTKEYYIRQPAAWERANELVTMFDSEMLAVRKEFLENWHSMESEIERSMEQFDMDKRLKAAQAIEDLRNFIITT